MAKDLVRTRRYVQKFYQMRTQLQAVGLRIQTLRSNQQMADAMRGATRVSRGCSLSKGTRQVTLTRVLQAMGAMNRGLNLPQIQRIMNEFEKESATMDMKEEMMSDAVDDVMDDELEDEEEEGDKILKQVLDEIGVDLSQQVRPVCADGRLGLMSASQLTDTPSGLAVTSSLTEPRQAVALGDSGGPAHHGAGGDSGAGSGGGGMSDEDALQARLDALRRG